MAHEDAGAVQERMEGDLAPMAVEMCGLASAEMTALAMGDQDYIGVRLRMTGRNSKRKRMLAQCVASRFPAIAAKTWLPTGEEPDIGAVHPRWRDLAKAKDWEALRWALRSARDEDCLALAEELLGPRRAEFACQAIDDSTLWLGLRITWLDSERNEADQALFGAIAGSCWPRLEIEDWADYRDPVPHADETPNRVQKLLQWIRRWSDLPLSTGS